MRVAIRVDGNRYIGLGHVFRCLHLATYLRDQRGHDPVFYLLESSMDSPGARFVSDAGFPMKRVSQAGGPWREDTVGFVEEAADADVAVVDLLEPDPGDDDLAPGGEFVAPDLGRTLGSLRRAGIPVLAFSDRFDHALPAADVVVNTCPAQRSRWYSEHPGRVLLGPEHYVLADSFRRAAKAAAARGDALKVVLFFGGYDHCGFTDRLLPVLEKRPEGLEITVVVGAATPRGEDVAQEVRARGHRAHYGVKDMAPVLAGADLAVTASGNTLFDLAALGVPALAVSTRQRQRVTARFFAAQGACFDLGMDAEDMANAMTRALDEISADTELMRRMGDAGRALVDGRGVERIADELERLSPGVGE